LLIGSLNSRAAARRDDDDADDDDDDGGDGSRGSGSRLERLALVLRRGIK